MNFWMKVFPYRKPGYEMDYVDAGEDVVGFDVRRCPPAAYFALHDRSELCTAAFCDLDYPLADRWGLVLDRPHTIARGADHCDFRYRRRQPVGSTGA